MLKFPGFHCYSCCNKSMPISDPHSHCLKCLGEGYVRHKCPICWWFKTRIEKFSCDISWWKQLCMHAHPESCCSVMEVDSTDLRAYHYARWHLLIAIVHLQYCTCSRNRVLRSLLARRSPLHLQGLDDQQNHRRRQPVLRLELSQLQLGAP